MTGIQRQVNKARSRLWLAIWLDAFCRTCMWTAAAMALAVLTVRLFGWTAPWGLISAAMVALTIVIATVWSVRARPTEAVAAAKLDEAVGLRERVSSSLLASDPTDPFTRAVQADAEARVSAVTVSQHLRLRFPDSGWRAFVALAVAAAMFLVPQGLLARAEAKVGKRQEVQIARTRAEVKKSLEDVKKLAATNPALADLKADLEKLDALPADKMTRPADMRQEALKKIDKLADAVRKKQESDKFDRVTETKKMLRAIKEPTGEKTPVQKLARQLSNGEFKSAKETIKQMQEQLATLKQDSDKEFTEKMQKQLEQLAQQMEKLADREQLKKKLEQAGIKKEDVERMLERLSKEDLEQIRKQLEKSGMSQKQIEKTCSQCKKQQGAAQSMSQMSEAMKSAAQAAGDGQMGEAMQNLEAAGDQLSDLEMLEQELNQLQSAASGLEQAKNQCNGQGQGQNPGQGPGQGQKQQGGGMGKLGQGKGGLATSQQTDVDFKIERGKVETTKGRIVGQFLVDGEQIKGEADESFVELITAGEREATDTVNRDRIPRQYHKALKEYFERLPGDLNLPTADEADSPQGEEGAPADADTTPAESGETEASD